jgi:hypothetical protein
MHLDEMIGHRRVQDGKTPAHFQVTINNSQKRQGLFQARMDVRLPDGKPQSWRIREDLRMRLDRSSRASSPEAIRALGRTVSKCKGVCRVK